MGWRSLLPVALLVLAQPRVGAAQCNASQLCAAGTGTCTVSSPCTIPAGATFDVRPRELVLAQGVRLTVGAGTDAVAISAAAIRLESGSQIVLQGVGGDIGEGGGMSLVATGGFVMRTGTLIQATGMDYGGEVAIDAGNDVVLDGTIDASANANDGAGGSVAVTSRLGRVTIGGNGVRADGGAKGELGGFGGTVAIESATNLTVDGPVSAARGDCFFCSIDLFAVNGSVTTTGRGTMDVRGSGGIGGGGNIGIAAGTTVDLSGAITATAAGSPEAGGERGGNVSVSAFEGNVLLAAPIDLTGAAPDGDGGALAVDATIDVRVVAPISVRTDAQGEGGSVALVSGRSVFIESSVDARGGGFGGGTIDVDAGGALDLVAAGSLMTDGRDGGVGGSVELEGCHVVIRPGAVVSSLGGGAAAVTTHGTMSIGGTLRAGNGGTNALVSREAAPVLLPSASITPAPEVALDDRLTCCMNCPVTTTTSSTSTSSTSTTSTSSSTSTSSTTTPSTSIAATSSTSSSSTSTSTTVVTTPTTTTTLEPGPCEDTPAESFQGLRCRLGILRDELASFSDVDLGGAKSARSLARRLVRAERQAAVAAGTRNPVRPLRRVQKELRRFASLLGRAEERGTIASEVAAVLRAASAAVAASLEGLRAQRARSASTVSMVHENHARANNTMPNRSSL
jgi:hypothetical protein